MTARHFGRKWDDFPPGNYLRSGTLFRDKGTDYRKAGQSPSKRDGMRDEEGEKGLSTGYP